MVDLMFFHSHNTTLSMACASATSFSKQQLTMTELQQSSNSLTNSPANSLQQLTGPAYNLSAWTAQKTPFLCCCLWAAA
jgi:hypothetical protein